MKARTNIALLAVLLALCAAYWYMVHSQQERKKQAVEAKRLFSFAPADVTTVSILREGERTSTGVRDADGTWRITEPMEIPANPIIWDRVAKTLAEFANQRTIEEKPTDLSLYKLDTPRLKVTAKTKDGESIALQFGEMDPTQKFRYALLGEGPVFLAGPDQFYEVDRDLTWLRDCDLLRKGKTGITHIEFTPLRAKPATPADQKPEVEESVTVIAEKDDNGVWSIVAPQPGTADQQLLNTLASDLQYARGRDYIDAPENLNDYQLDPPKARVRVRTDKDSDLQTVYFGAFEPAKKENAGVYAMQEGRPSVFVVDANIVAGFPLSGPDAWREKRIITRQGSDITALKYQAGPQQFLLVKDESRGWMIKEPQEEATDQAAVSRFIGEMLQMKGSASYVERKPEFGLDVPAIRITLTYKDVDSPAEILVGAGADPDSDRYYVTQDSGVVTTLDRSDVEKLTKSAKDFMTRSLMSFSKNAAREIELTLEGTKYRFVRGEQTWKIAEPADKVWESQDDMQALIDTFAALNADSVDQAAAPPDLSVFGLDKPLLTIIVTTKASDASAPTVLGPLALGKLCPDDDHLRYAMLAGRPQIYRVKQTPVSAVRNALRGIIAQ